VHVGHIQIENHQAWAFPGHYLYRIETVPRFYEAQIFETL